MRRPRLAIGSHSSVSPATQPTLPSTRYGIGASTHSSPWSFSIFLRAFGNW